MCGICGFFHIASQPDESCLERMCAAISHRGPDSSEVSLFSGTGGDCGLGHVRLSIIDLVGGLQPMSNKDASVWISYNGEVYNHLLLKEDLEKRGYQYKSRCDTESLVYLYEEYGEAIPEYLRGMFAFAIWDAKKQQLLLCRDRLGIKPLYYAMVEGGIVFASEIKAILASGLISPQIEPSAMIEYTSLGYVADEQTLFAGIKKLPGGHTLLFRPGQEAKIDCYWDVRYDQQVKVDEEEAVARIRELFYASVRMRMMSDVPLGVFLSGGLDSSAIAGVMAALSSSPVQAFSVGFEKKYYSETGYARAVAEHNGMLYRECVLRPEDFVASLDELVWHYDAPIHFPASVALYHLSRLARQYVTVVLTGEGSDEIFGGYGRYMSCHYNMKLARLFSFVAPHRVRGFLRKNLWQWPLPIKIKKGIAHSFLYHSQQPEQLVFDNYYRLNGLGNMPQLFSPDFCADSNIDISNYLRHFSRWPQADIVSKMLYTDKKTYLEELLMKQDKMSMAASIESRVPFLDHKLVEYAATLPTSLKIRPGNLKYILKKSMASYVPSLILKRQKMGFPIPLGQWMREPYFNGYLRDILMEKRTRERGLFQSKVVEQILTEHEKGSQDNSFQLWMLLNFEIWCRRFIDHPL